MNALFELFATGTDWSGNSEKVFAFADAILFLIFFIQVLYLFLFALSSLKKMKYTYPMAKKKYKFTVLFPAYKEDDVIVEAIESFFQQNYPRDLYNIFVISDQMTDTTNQNLESLSAVVLKLQQEKSTKTNALQTAIHYIESTKDKYDIVLVMDADNIVENNYLNNINDAFYSGCSAVQTHRMAKNRDTSIAVLDAISEEINNSIFRKGHTRLGFSSALIGSGMAFEYDIFKENIMNANDVGVDKQLEINLLGNNVYIDYLEDTHIFDEKVRGKNGFYNQRRRWLSNQFTNLFWGLSSLPKAIFTRNWDYCDKLFQWIMLPRVILFGFITLIAFFMTLFNWSLSIKWWGLLFLLCITFSIAIPDYLVDKKFRKAIMTIPLLFLLMFFNFFRLKGANKEFIHTVHTPN